MLHVAPEECLEKNFRFVLKEGYTSVDKSSERAMFNMDITYLQFGSQVFDFVYCSHVLEHVVEDIQAMQEIKRVLKYGGFAIINVPLDVNRSKTFEDINVINPNERLKKFGQPDHVRIYGKDYIKRLRSVGFIVKEIKPKDILTKKQIQVMGITKAAGSVFYCKKGE